MLNLAATMIINLFFMQLGWSALMWASQTQGGKKYTSDEAIANRREVAKILLANGADVNLTTNVCS